MTPRAQFLLTLALVLSISESAFAEEPPQEVTAEVVVYGASPSGVMAAVAAARHGHTVALVEMNKHVGGLTAAGLTNTDMGDRQTVGGLADEFLKRVVNYYVDTYGKDSSQVIACHEGHRGEPHVEEGIFEQMLKGQAGISVWKGHRFRAVSAEGGRITSIVADDLSTGRPRTFNGTIFIDASYTGDVMAAAHVPYRVGRESRAEYGEYLAGISFGPKQIHGLGDQRTMAYNYRASITSKTENRVLFPKPEHYDPEPFRKTDGARILEHGETTFAILYSAGEEGAGPNDKYDSNWCDFPENSEGYADGDYETRARIEARERDYFLSRCYYLQNDPGLPAAFLEDARKWGFPKDEFPDNGNFPFQIYVREARRMIGRYVLNENDLTQDRWKQGGIATGSYGVDCHVVQMILQDGREVPEHTRHTALNNYDIPYDAITPFAPSNLLVPVCCSATHVAYCSLRMEPVYMMLGQAAGTAAHVALADQTTVQKVSVPKLRELLSQDGAVLDAGYQTPVKLWWTPTHPKPDEKVILKVIPASGGIKDPIAHIDWDFEGNGRVGGDGDRVVHAFSQEKTYSVSAVVTDKAGRRRLLTADVPVGAAEAHDVTMDDFDAEEFGRWDGTYPENLPGLPLRYSDIFVGPGVHRDVVRKGKKAPARIRFQPMLPRAGRYQVCLGFRPAKSQATNVPITIRHAEGTTKVTANERNEITPFVFSPIGEFKFKAGDSGFVEITNGETDGRVAVDGMRWVWLGD